MRIPTTEEANRFLDCLNDAATEKSGALYAEYLKDIKPECYNKAFFSTDKLFCKNPVIKDGTIIWDATPFNKNGELVEQKTFVLATDELAKQFRKDAGFALWNMMNYNSEPEDL